MDKKLKIKPNRLVVSPDQTSTTLRVPPNASGNTAARIFVRDTPEGVKLEKVSRSKWKASWEAPLRERVKIVLWAEDVAGSQRLTCELVPDKDALAKHDGGGASDEGAEKPDEAEKPEA